MEKITVLVLILLNLLILSGCQKKEVSVSFDSYLLSDTLLVEDLKNSDDQFAFIITESNQTYTQTIYIWDNKLRRELRQELIQLTSLLESETRRVSLFQTVVNLNPLEDFKITLNHRDLMEYPDVNLSSFIISVLFPRSFYIKESELKQSLLDMIIRLETLEEHGDTEVISIQTITNEDIRLNQVDLNVMYRFHDIEDISLWLSLYEEHID